MKIEEQFAEALRREQVRLYRKIGNVVIRPATPGEVVETWIDGERETVNTAKAGDYVVRGARGEHYVLTPEILASRYGVSVSDPEPQGFREFPAQGTLLAFQYEGPPGKFVAPWGEEMIVNPGDFIGTPAVGSNHYYRVERSAFFASYADADC